MRVITSKKRARDRDYLAEKAHYFAYRQVTRLLLEVLKSIAQPVVVFERGTRAVGRPARRPRHLRGVLRVVSERAVHLRLGETHAKREAADCHVGALACSEERAPLPARLTPAE